MDLISLILILFITLLPLIYLYTTRNYSYWSKRGVVGPKPIPFFGNLLDFFRTPQPLQEINWIRKYGKVYGYYMRNDPVLTISDPQLIKQILVKDFHLFTDRRNIRSKHPIISNNLVEATGDQWKRIRSIASPTFTSGKMKKMYPLIRQCVNEFVKHLDSYAISKKCLNVKDIYGNLTMDVIAICAFATKTNSLKELDSPFVRNARKVFNLDIKSVVLFMVIPTKVFQWWRRFKNRNEHRGTEFFIESTRKLIADRQKTGQKYNDFLQLLIDVERDDNSSGSKHVRDDSDVNEAHHVNEGDEELDVERKALNIVLDNKHLTENEILAQALIFFLAGYETTASTLTFCTYELAVNPNIQEKLYEEINSAVDSDGEISYDELSRLPYLDAVLSETLRRHSVAQRLARLPSVDYKLGDTGITLYKGQQIEIPVQAIHHLEEFYPNAHQFNPERFMPDNRHKIKSYTYLPFGAGPRNCIGMRFALLEAKLALVHIIRKYRFVRTPETDVPLQYRKAFRLASPKRVLVGIEKRQ